MGKKIGQYDESPKYSIECQRDNTTLRKIKIQPLLESRGKSVKDFNNIPTLNAHSGKLRCWLPRTWAVYPVKRCKFWVHIATQSLFSWNIIVTISTQTFDKARISRCVCLKTLIWKNVLKNHWLALLTSTRGGSRAAPTSKMERFVIIANGWKPLQYLCVTT